MILPLPVAFQGLHLNSIHVAEPEPQIAFEVIRAEQATEFSLTQILFLLISLLFAWIE